VERDEEQNMIEARADLGPDYRWKYPFTVYENSGSTADAQARDAHLMCRDEYIFYLEVETDGVPEWKTVLVVGTTSFQAAVAQIMAAYPGASVEMCQLNPRGPSSANALTTYDRVLGVRPDSDCAN
jgi:hypothetical protein